MKNLGKYMLAIALGCVAMGAAAQEIVKQDWGDFKLWIDPGHSGNENTGLFNYSEAKKVLRVGLATREYLFTYTTATEENIQMTRDDDEDNVSLDERSDMANAWGADFFYSIHSDAGAGNVQSTTVFLFGGWKLNGEYIEKTPHGGKRYGDILCPNLTGVMYNQGTRGNFYDRVFYNGDVDTHENQYPYLSVNRRTNMASLLSEGGFHTHPVQQGLNMNDSYKRLEAFGTFRSLMEYVGLDRPDKVMLPGVVLNDENNQGIDGVLVQLCDENDNVLEEITTDSFESLFHNYVRNAGIVHNGFFLFENVEPGATYKLKYSADGFTSATQTVTMNSNPQGLASENVTWGNISLTNEAPAVVSGNSIYNPDAVNTRNDMVITFSRKMNQATVEEAFSINNGGQVTLSWDNEYTLRVNLSQLLEDMFYKVTINGSVARNSQTNQLLDGDGDGVEGGDYVFNFITMPADVENPYVASTTPANGSTMMYTHRPVIRVEFNEELDWNEDQAVDAIVVTDKDGNKYEGTLEYEVVRDASVLHLYFSEDLPLDKAFLVTVKGGFKDLAGNVSEPMFFKFLSEYRTVVESTQLVPEVFNEGEWYSPGGSGSSKGFTAMEDQWWFTSTNVSDKRISQSYGIHYEFDPETTEPWWGLRCYNRTNDGNYGSLKKTGFIIQAYVHGDGSGNRVGHGVRWRTEGGYVKRHTTDYVNRGWDLISWDVNNEEGEIVSGTQTLVTDGMWCYDAFWIWRGLLEEFEDDDPDEPRAAWTGEILFDDLKKVKYGEEEQEASLDDIEDPIFEAVLTSITLNATDADNIVLQAGETFQLNVVEWAPEAADPTVTWSTSDENVAIVDETGLVTAMDFGANGAPRRAPGEGAADGRPVTITATSVSNPQVSASVTMTVMPVQTGVNDINAGKAIVSVKYVNAAGQESNTPFDGVNMVISTYSDGSTQVMKVVK